MKFGLFYALQVPKPWDETSELRRFQEALEQVELADRLGFGYAWQVEHHFLDEYSHSSAPEVFLAAAAARTQRIRLGHGIRQVIPNYNHPARTAECLATLDILSGGRVDFGIGEGATRLELGGFKIPAREKRAMCLEAAEQIANMMVLEPYPGFDGRYFSMPCRNVLPKPVQKPHPPIWMACTNRETIKVAASLGVGALSFSFLDPEEAKQWAGVYYDIIKSDRCVPLGHSVNANIAMVSSFSLHRNREEAIRRGHEGIEFLGYALNALITRETVPGRTNLWSNYLTQRGNRTEQIIQQSRGLDIYASGIGTPDDMRRHLRGLQDVGIDQVILLQQAGRIKHEHICEALELFADEVMDEFHSTAAARDKRKQEELAPYIEAAMKRKGRIKPLSDKDIPVVRASVGITQIARAEAGVQTPRTLRDLVHR
jgi:alkanesulfonate monooxygenase SsuD/methylene tetrahydromethanopterin reductase-like flavin-dependent oxidoreductase (luciferase family)